MIETDVLIVGAGALGLATAYQLQQSGVHRVTVIEKEAKVAAHQTGRNSGVLHSGIYYAPGSLKAETCRIGKAAMELFCERTGVTYEQCGKVVVATGADELPMLERTQERARANGVRVERIGPERLRELEPSASGVAALWVPGTGIVDFAGVCRKLAELIEVNGGSLRFRTELRRARATHRRVLVETSSGPIEARVVVACAGIQADRVAQCLGISPRVRIVPFRGEYHLLAEQARTLVKNLIYPVPDPKLPFLGVHFTRRFDGTIDCGPNAVLAAGREDYARDGFDFTDLVETLSFPGFLRLALTHRHYGLGELYRSLSKAAFTKALQRLVPSLRVSDLVPGPTGIRAQAVTPEGQLYNDFAIEEGHRVLCVMNAPSPAATASLEIGRLLAERVKKQLGSS